MSNDTDDVAATRKNSVSVEQVQNEY